MWRRSQDFRLAILGQTSISGKLDLQLHHYIKATTTSYQGPSSPNQTVYTVGIYPGTSTAILVMDLTAMKGCKVCPGH